MTQQAKSRLFIIVGGFFGDEGKGAITSYIATSQGVNAIIRAGVGTNAGHTVVFKDVKYRLRTIPSGFMVPRAKLFIGAGVLINENILFKEIKETKIEGRIYLDRHTGVITEEHIAMEKQNSDLMGRIGSTGSGSGAANAQRVYRKLKVAKDYDSLLPYITNVSKDANEILDNGGSIIIEGSQATFLSLYHGFYPYVTSKDVTSSACLSDVGIGPTRVTDIVVVFKAFVTRVGEGDMRGEISFDEAKERGWDEYGTVTGRPRRAAPFDFDLAKEACQINGATSIALTKMDILFSKLKGRTDQVSITKEAWEFIRRVESETGVKVKYVSTGPAVSEVIEL